MTPFAFAAFHNQVDGEVFDKKFGVVFEGLLIQGVQDGVAGSVRRGAGSLGLAFAIVRGHAAKRPLVYFAFGGARKRHAVVFQFDDRVGRFLAHVFDGVLVAEPVRALDRVIHMPAPVVLAHVAEGGAHPPLSGDGVAAGREQFGDASGAQPFEGHAKSRPQAGTTGADHHHIVLVIGNGIGFSHGLLVTKTRCAARNKLRPPPPASSPPATPAGFFGAPRGSLHSPR